MKHHALLSTAAIAAASLATAQDVTSTNNLLYTITSRGPNDDVPNLSSTLIPSVITLTSLTITVPTTLATLSNHLPGTATIPFSSPACQTVTAQGEPVFSIQTDTTVPTACTVTVFSPTGSPATGPAITGSTSIVLINGTTTSTSTGGRPGTNTTISVSTGMTPTTTGPAMQTTGAGNALRLGGEGLGVAAVLGAVVAWL